MTPREARAVLVKAFSALPQADKARLKYHLEKKTPICCGKNADQYIDGTGGG